MKLSTLVLTTLLTLSTATAAQAKPYQVTRAWGNFLQHKVRHHQRSNQHQRHQQQNRHRQPNNHQRHQQQVNHNNHRQHRRARPHRPIHHPAYPYYQSQIRH